MEYLSFKHKILRMLLGHGSMQKINGYIFIAMMIKQYQKSTGLGIIPILQKIDGAILNGYDFWTSEWRGTIS